MPEKNQFKDANPLKKKEKHQNLCIFTHLYTLLLGLCRRLSDSYFVSNKPLFSDGCCE